MCINQQVTLKPLQGRHPVAGAWLEDHCGSLQRGEGATERWWQMEEKGGEMERSRLQRVAPTHTRQSATGSDPAGIPHQTEA